MAKMVENDRAKALCYFKSKIFKQLPASQLDIVVVDKLQKTTVVIDVVIPANSNIKKKKYKKIEK